MEKVRNEVKKFMEERNWMDPPLEDVAKSIIIEAAELLEHFQWSSFFQEEIEKNPAARQEIVDELADVFIYAIEMSLLLDCSIENIVHDKLLRAAKKYPINKVNGKLGSQKYRDIKKKYRSNK